MSINLSVALSHPAAIATQVSYARIDNLAPGSAPVFINIPNLVGGAGTYIIATDIPNGQYQINYTPVYADGRVCQTYTTYTAGCPGLISISATIQSNVIVITYLAPSSVPNILLTVAYPNGGSFQNTYVNTGNPISVPMPAGYGNYTVTGQSVCDSSSGFYSPPSNSVTVSYNNPISGTYYLGNTITQVCTAVSTTLFSDGAPVPGGKLYLDEALSTVVTGYVFVMYQGVIYSLSSTSGVLGANTGQQCGPTVSLNNSMAFINVTSISGIAGYSFVPFSGVFNQYGSHAAFTGAIAFTFTGTIPGSPVYSVSLFVNGTLVQCIAFTAGTYTNSTITFNSNTYLATDIIEITANLGTCP